MKVIIIGKIMQLTDIINIIWIISIVCHSVGNPIEIYKHNNYLFYKYGHLCSGNIL